MNGYISRQNESSSNHSFLRVFTRVPRSDAAYAIWTVQIAQFFRNPRGPEYSVATAKAASLGAFRRRPSLSEPAVAEAARHRRRQAPARSMVLATKPDLRASSRNFSTTSRRALLPFLTKMASVEDPRASYRKLKPFAQPSARPARTSVSGDDVACGPRRRAAGDWPPTH